MLDSCGGGLKGAGEDCTEWWHFKSNVLTWLEPRFESHQTLLLASRRLSWFGEGQNNSTAHPPQGPLLSSWQVVQLQSGGCPGGNLLTTQNRRAVAGERDRERMKTVHLNCP